jgi:hypothetical protein
MDMHIWKDNINVISTEGNNLKHINVKIVLFKHQHLIEYSFFSYPCQDNTI